MNGFDQLRRLSQLGPALHFDPVELNEQIETHGIGAELRRAMLCPCRPNGRAEARVGCTTCKGIGYFYPEQMREPTMVLVSSRRAKQTETMAGRHWAGTAQCTFPTGIVPTRGDMLLPEKEIHVVLQVFRREKEEINPSDLREQPYTANRRVVDKPAAGGVPSGLEYLLYSDITEIEAVVFQEAQGRTSRSLVADPSTYYLEDRRINWKDGFGPEHGRGYAVRYRAPAAYMLGDAAPVVRVEHSTAMPYQTTAERLDRWGDPDVRT